MAAKMTYEQAMARLEEIVTKLDDGSLPLDESIKLFERGTELAGECRKTLETAKQKIITLTQAEEENEQELLTVFTRYRKEA